MTLLLGLTAAQGEAPMDQTDDQTPRVYYGHPSGRHTKDPSVVRLGETYFMYHSIQQADGSWGMAVARSENLLDWEHAADLKMRLPDGKAGSAAPDAIVLDGKVRLFFQSYGGPADANVDGICYAESDDGVTFTQPEMVEHLFAPSGDWNNGRAIDAEPHVIGEQLYVYWATRDPKGQVQMVGAHRAPLAGDAWQEVGAWEQVNPDEPLLAPTQPTAADDATLDLAWEKRCIEAATLVEHDGLHYMFYAGGYNNDPQQIGVAISEDGRHFRRLFDGQPLLSPGPAGSWNAGESGHPGVFRDRDGRDYLFYQGDDPENGVPWHLSMVPIRWTPSPDGGPDVPLLDFNDPMLASD